MPVTLHSGVAGVGYGFSIRSENKRPLVTLSFGTREDAEQARADVAPQCDLRRNHHSDLGALPF
jgi:hypothetical protein